MMARIHNYNIMIPKIIIFHVIQIYFVPYFVDTSFEPGYCKGVVRAIVVWLMSVAIFMRLQQLIIRYRYSLSQLLQHTGLLLLFTPYGFDELKIRGHVTTKVLFPRM